ncbi:hypothetical protein [Streptomyces sp. NPDC056453]|uniref:hypothetical protein n=1 Tax=Streptomyces sp. NPDC056453 TaxID=3345822 RepID=UPI0036C379F2
MSVITVRPAGCHRLVHAVSHILRPLWSIAFDHALMSATLSAVTPSILTKSMPQEANRSAMESMYA